MKKLALVVLFTFLLASLLFAQSSTATLEIEAYKLEKTPVGGTLRVYVYDTSSSVSSTTAVDKEIDISNFLSSYISGSKNVFSIKIQSNLSSKITVTISAFPFISKDDEQSVIATRYSLTATGGSYTTTNSYSLSSGSGSGGNGGNTGNGGGQKYYYRYDTTTSMSPSSFTVGSSGSKTSSSAQIRLTVSALYSNNRNWLANYKWGTTYTIPTTSSTLDPIEEDAILESTIQMKMQLLNTNLDNIKANVEYVAPVTIMVSIE